MIRVIPEKKIHICDICGKEHKPPSHNPKLIYIKDALDWGNVPVADASEKYDMCSSCDSKFSKLLKTFISDSRKVQETLKNDFIIM